MAKLVIVSFSDGKSYAVPAEFIAKHRAEYYVDRDIRSGATGDRGDLIASEIAWVLDDNLELMDWARNNMNWSDVQAKAVEVKTVSPEPDYEAEWSSADMEII